MGRSTTAYRAVGRTELTGCSKETIGPRGLPHTGFLCFQFHTPANVCSP